MKMKIDRTQHLTIAQYSADLTADGMTDPMLTHALNAISSKTFQVQFGDWTGSPPANAEQALVLTAPSTRCTPRSRRAGVQEELRLKLTKHI